MRVVGLLHHTFSYLIIKTEIQDGVHHTWHRSTSTRTNADEERILQITELGVHECFDVLYSSCHFFVEKFHDFLLTNFVVFVAAISCNCESRRNRNTDQVHFGKVSTLTAKFLSHFSISLGFTVTEEINSFLTHNFKSCFHLEHARCSIIINRK